MSDILTFIAANPTQANTWLLCLILLSLWIGKFIFYQMFCAMRDTLNKVDKTCTQVETLFIAHEEEDIRHFKSIEDRINALYI